LPQQSGFVIIFFCGSPLRSNRLLLATQLASTNQPAYELTIIRSAITPFLGTIHPLAPIREIASLDNKRGASFAAFHP
jgi:hypothetical protein